MLLMVAWVWCLMLLMLAVSCRVRQERESYWNHCAGYAATCQGLSFPVSSVSPVLCLLELSSQPVALKWFVKLPSASPSSNDASNRSSGSLTLAMASFSIPQI